jgi:hypothetical protein
LSLSPDGEASVEFERQFEKPGSHLVSVILDNDALLGDNRSDAVVVVTASLPVLLVDGDRKLDPTRSETFFAKAALAAAGAEVSWIKPTVITPDELNVDLLRKAAVVVLANVPSIPAETQAVLEKLVASGHGLLFTLGDKIPKEGYALERDSPAAAIFPVRLREIGTEPPGDQQGIRVAGNSLELPWLRAFRTDKGGTLTDARFSKWWKVDPAAQEQNKNPEGFEQNSPRGRTHHVTIGTALVVAKLTNGDAWLVTRRYDRGMTAVLTSSLDADWNTFPAKTDYVPWLHELLFSVASTSTNRNVDVGTPLVLSIPTQLKVEDYEFVGPSNKRFPAERIMDDLQPGAILSDVGLAGIYRFSPKAADGKPTSTDEHFVVNFDRGESDLTRLTQEERTRLSGESRLTFAEDLSELEKRMFADSSRTEVWWLVIYGFLALTSIEVWMTRRMLRGATEPAAPA